MQQRSEQVFERIRQLEQLVRQMAELQTRQIDREKNVPGSDPAELAVIEADLAAARALARALAEMHSEANAGRPA